MPSLSQHDKDLIIEIVAEVLAEEPEELAVFAATSEDVLQQAVDGDLVLEADSDTFFGDLHLSLGELLVHVLVAIAIDCTKYLILLTREVIRDRLEARLREKSTTTPPELIPVLKRAVAHLSDETSAGGKSTSSKENSN